MEQEGLDAAAAARRSDAAYREGPPAVAERGDACGIHRMQLQLPHHEFAAQLDEEWRNKPQRRTHTRKLLESTTIIAVGSDTGTRS